jgi:hypothetical protein
MRHIAKKDINHREEKTAAESKQEKAGEWYEEVKPGPIKREPEDNEEQNQWDHRQKKINKIRNNGS